MKKMKRVFSLLMVLAFMMSFSVSAFAAEYDLTVGDVSVSADDTGTYVTQTNTEYNNYKDETPVVITSHGTETSNTVSIESQGDAVAELTFENVRITTDEDESAVDIADGSTVVLNIEGTNDLRTGADEVYDENGDWLSDPEKAVIHVADADLTIQGNGSMNVDGDSPGESYGAAIGSHAGEDFSGSITIAGNVRLDDVDSGNDGAGIGSGENGSFTKDAKVTIKDSAYVDVESDSDGAAIGSGQYGDFSGTITIEGNAVVEAGSENDGAGIGAGEEGNFTKDGTVNIGGNAEVDAGSDEDGAGIGAGQDGAFAGTIHITGEAQVEAWSGRIGAGIGSGENGSFTGTVNISGSEDGGPMVEAESEMGGAGIGSGGGADFRGKIQVSQAEVTATAGGSDIYEEYIDEYRGSGAGIGSGAMGSFAGEVDIRSASVKATSQESWNEYDDETYGGYGAGIGSGQGGDFTGSGLVFIEDAEVTAGSAEEGTAIGAPDYMDFNGSIVVRGDSSLSLSDSYGDDLLGNGYDSNGAGYVVLEETVSVYDDITKLEGESLWERIGARLMSYREWLAMRNPGSQQDLFWQNVLQQIREAEKGAEITVDVGARTSIPARVLKAVSEQEVTLIIQWDGGEDLTIHKDFVPEQEAELYQLADLAAQLAR